MFIHDFLNREKPALLYGELCCNSYSNWNQTILQVNRKSLLTFSSNCMQEVKVFQVARSMMQPIVSETNSLKELPCVKRFFFPDMNNGVDVHNVNDQIEETATHFILLSSAFKVWTPSLPATRVPKRAILSGTKASPCNKLVVWIRWQENTFIHLYVTQNESKQWTVKCNYCLHSTTTDRKSHNVLYWSTWNSNRNTIGDHHRTMRELEDYYNGRSLLVTGAHTVIDHRKGEGEWAFYLPNVTNNRYFLLIFTAFSKHTKV